MVCSAWFLFEFCWIYFCQMKVSVLTFSCQVVGVNAFKSKALQFNGFLCGILSRKCFAYNGGVGKGRRGGKTYVTTQLVDQSFINVFRAIGNGKGRLFEAESDQAFVEY